MATGFNTTLNEVWPNTTITSESPPWAASVSGQAPAYTITANTQISITNTTPISFYSRKYIFQLAALGITDVNNKLIRARITMGAASSQFFSLWGQLNTTLTNKYGIRLFLNNSTLTIQRVSNIENATPGTATVGSTSSVTVTGGGTTDYVVELQVTGTGVNRTYTGKIFDAAGTSQVGATASASAVTDANTDLASYPIGFSTQDACVVKWITVQDLESPNISADPVSGSAIAGNTFNVSVTAANGAQGGGTITYQWQLSTNSGGSWANVSTGTGGTTSSYTTAALVSGDNNNQYRCICSNTTKNTTSAAAVLTVTTFGYSSSTTVGTHGETGIDVTFNASGFTYTTPLTTDFSVDRNGGSAVGIASISRAGAVVTLTLSRKILITDTPVRVSYIGGAGKISNSGTDAPAFTNNTVTNASTVNVTCAITTPYDTLRVRNGKGHGKTTINLTRTNFTGSMTLSVAITGTPTGVSATYTDPGSGTQGFVDITATSGASVNGTGIACTVTATDGDISITANFTLYVDAAVSSANTVQIVLGPGSSTIDKLRVNSVLTNITARFIGGTNNWAFHALGEDDGEFGQSGATCQTYGVGHSSGYLHILLNWISQYNAQIAMSIWPYANNSGVGTSFATLAAFIQPALQLVADNVAAVILMPAYAQYNGTAIHTGTVSSSSGTTITVSGWTPDSGGTDTGQILLIANPNGYMARDIVSVNAGAGTITVSSAYGFTVTNGNVAKTVPIASYTDVGTNYNGTGPTVGIQRYCVGGTLAISNVYWFDTNLFLLERDYIELGPPITHATATYFATIASMFQDALTNYVLGLATVTVTPATPVVTTNAPKQFAASVTGFTALGTNNTFFPDGEILGTYTVQAGTGSIDTSTGVYTSPNTPGTATIRHALNYLTSKYGETSLTITYAARRTPGGRVGSRTAR